MAFAYLYIGPLLITFGDRYEAIDFIIEMDALDMETENA